MNREWKKITADSLNLICILNYESLRGSDVEEADQTQQSYPE